VSELAFPPPANLEALTEASFQTQVIHLARLMGWWHLHIRDMQANRELAGFPDLCFLRDGQYRLIELKSIKGKERRSQIAFKEKVIPYGIDVWLFQPTEEDWSLLVEVLR
jgi:hypothetical protein